MASQLPAKLRSLDVSRFAMRAAQLEKIKPFVSYWCYYHIVNKVLASGLHNADDECKAYTVLLLDKCESLKEQHPYDAAMHDDQAARQAIAEFGLATFERADKARRGFAATKQTADTYLAACTFLELLKTWDSTDNPEEDIPGKIKAAKYHALRIANALKSGKDPNERPPEPPAPALQDDDPEVQAINAAASQQPSVEEETVSDENSYYYHQPSDHRYNASPTFPPPAEENRDMLNPGEPKPDSFHPSPVSPGDNPRKGSAGGGYFPEIDPNTPEQYVPPSAPAPAPVSPISPRPPYHPSAAPSTNESQYYQTPPRQPAASSHPPAPPVHVSSPPPLSPPQPPQNYQAHPPPHQYYQPPQQAPQHPHQHYAPKPAASPIAAPRQALPLSMAPPMAAQAYRSDDESVAAAQKHAKWAISALNFDDPSTAVKELRLALQSLGTQ